ncbi:hypothetical protein BU25DRAFT_420255 [Macroventuria anomochaeta]|uniref:Uncharacterized protein n=1 Tax=Macroventuria anomochaeta TaxID=301207 RepID=A0ACB6S8E8_9PLEO|nr:uncharacterized protein BU25DRAFT_420255 [Macroventuria anomochaeta]KAF2629407.1 hypothetical protein BU25DRAFT_420255 [Macroventuria anomochaeta]
MSTSTAGACSCAGGDSALSTTANIISILIFAYVLLVGGLYQFASYQQSNGDTSELLEKAAEFRTQTHELKTRHQEMNAKLKGLAKDTAVQAQEQNTNVTNIIGNVEKERGHKWCFIWREITFKPLRERVGLTQQLDLLQGRLHLKV